MPSIDPQAAYPPSPALGGLSRENPHDRYREVSVRQPPSHAYPHQVSWNNGSYGHHVHGAPPTHPYHPQQIAGGAPETSKVHGPPPVSNTSNVSPHYPPHLVQHYPLGMPGTYHSQHQPQGPASGYGGPPPPHLYPFRSGPWGYGMPAGYDQQQRQSFSTQHPNQTPVPSHLTVNQSTQQRQQNPAQPQSASSNTSVSTQGQKSEHQSDKTSEIPKLTTSDTENIPAPPQSQKTTQHQNAAKSISDTGGISSDSNEIAKPLSVGDKQSPDSKIVYSDYMETDRARTKATAEISLAEVKPIQSDFHFFVHEMRPSFLSAAEAEVSRAIVVHEAPIEKNTTKYNYLVNSNLNCRLLHAWEKMTMDERTEFMKKEEEDRRRFMDEDEVASRHCFTLTARVRSPNKNKMQSFKGVENGEDYEDLPESKSMDREYEESDKNCREAAHSPVAPTSKEDIPFSAKKNDSSVTVSPKASNGVEPKNDGGTTTFKVENNIVTPPTKKDDIEEDKGEPLESDSLVSTPDKGIGMSQAASIENHTKERANLPVLETSKTSDERQLLSSETTTAKRLQDAIENKDESSFHKKNRTVDA